VPKLFHLRCSPRAASESSAGAEVFVTRFQQARPSWDIDLMDIWRETLPEFDGDALEAKYARLSGREFSATLSPGSNAWRCASRSPIGC
jgi:FMN-dependent NADH-azoreductase